MTEKTHVIAALRDKHELALKDLTERMTECNRLNYCWDELSAFAAFSGTVIDQLEAALKQVAHLDAENTGLRLIMGNMRDNAESQLRGEQEPTEYQVHDYAGLNCIVGTLAEAQAEAEKHNGTIRPMWDAPPKPVVMREKVKPFKEVAPNDVVPVGNDWFRVRYITRHGDKTTLYLQREAEKLHPLKQNDVIHLSVENAVPLMIVVKDGE